MIGMRRNEHTAIASSSWRRKRGGRACRVSGITLALLIAATLSGYPASAEVPRRVVSFNLCADQLVVALADAGQIAGLSPYATDPTLSAVAEAARGFRRLPRQAESIIPVDPDLVLVGPRDRSATQRLLRALGLRVVEVDFVSTLAAAGEQILQVARLLGQPHRGETLLASIDAARQRLAAVRRANGLTALLIGQAGYAEGRVSLAAALLREAGLEPPLAAPRGIGEFVPLESLVMMRPDILVQHHILEQPRDQGSVYLTHPAINALYPPSRRIELPGRYTLCAGPGLVKGMDHLADAITRLATAPPSRR